MSTTSRTGWRRHATAIAAQACLEPGQFPVPGLPVAAAPLTYAAALRLDSDEIAIGSRLYYIKRGCDCLVKIGFTEQPLQVRVAQLSSAYPDPYLVADEPGGRYVEAFRHKQFAALRALPAMGVPGGTEWFWPYGLLEDHMIHLSPFEVAA